MPGFSGSIHVGDNTHSFSEPAVDLDALEAAILGGASCPTSPKRRAEPESQGPVKLEVIEETSQQCLAEPDDSLQDLSAQVDSETFDQEGLNHCTDVHGWGHAGQGMHNTRTAAIEAQARHVEELEEQVQQAMHATVPERKATLCISNLAITATKKDLGEFFAEYSVLSITISTDDVCAGRASGHAFIILPHEQAGDAMMNLTGSSFLGRKIVVYLVPRFPSANQRPGTVGISDEASGVLSMNRSMPVLPLPYKTPQMIKRAFDRNLKRSQQLERHGTGSNSISIKKSSKKEGPRFNRDSVLTEVAAAKKAARKARQREKSIRRAEDRRSAAASRQLQSDSIDIDHILGTDLFPPELVTGDQAARLDSSPNAVEAHGSVSESKESQG